MLKKSGRGWQKKRNSAINSNTLTTDTSLAAVKEPKQLELALHYQTTKSVAKSAEAD